MRKLKLWNYNETVSIDLNSKDNLVTEITGFGSNYNAKRVNQVIYDVEEKYEPITLVVNFGVGNYNPYSAYYTFMLFVRNNRSNRFVIEYDYSDYQSDSGSRYCDVWLVNAPKTQKDQFGLITEKFVFERVSPWYKKRQASIAGSGSTVDIVNQHIKPIPLTFIYPNQSVAKTVELTLFDLPPTYTVQTIITVAPVYALQIDSEQKKVLCQKSTSTPLENGYDVLSKHDQSFMYVPLGGYSLRNTDSWPGAYVKYKEWLVD